jgi:mRNA interferase MazF
VSAGFEIGRGEIWWADLPEARGSEPAFRRPVLIIQENSFNRSRIQTVIVAVLTGNVQLANAPGNVLLPGRVSDLSKDSVINVSQILTLDRDFLIEYVSTLPSRWQASVDAGLRRVLDLPATSE